MKKPRGAWAAGWFAAASDLLFPPRCAGCGRLGAHWCPRCAQQALRLQPPQCPRCGYPLLRGDEGCRMCPPGGFAFEAAASWAAYQTELRRAILKLKHKPNAPLGAQLAGPLAGLVGAAGWQPDAVLSVPLSTQRRAQRGFNPVDLLARPLAAALGLPLLAAIRRQRDTRPQMDLTVGERWVNVQAAFVAEPQVGGGSLLLVDDIMTTGATLDAAARALRAAGAGRVYALTLARTLQAEIAAALVH